MDLINILIRTGSRPDKFRRCLYSIKSQTYKNIRVICSVDKPCNYIPENIEQIKVTKGEGRAYWNLYCNELKSQVKEGWSMFLDDDDELINSTAIERAMKYLTDPDVAYIFQMERWGRKIPDDEHINKGTIERGQVGNPCLFLHSKHKGIANFDNQPAADFRFIKAVTEKLDHTFIGEVIVKVHEKSNGIAEVILHRSCPSREDKNLGKSYNDAMKLIGEDDWMCFTDNDVLFLTSDTMNIISNYIKGHPNAGLFTCYTNRIANSQQLLNGKISEDDSIKNHILIAEKQKSKLYQVTQLRSIISGFLMVLSKKTWKKINFDETGGALSVDNLYSKKILLKGKKILRMDGLYCFHIYRLIQGSKNKTHLL